MVYDRLSKGIDPSYVGELVREGIENDWPYIFTDLEFEPMIESRFASIKQGFDRIRGREPRIDAGEIRPPVHPTRQGETMIGKLNHVAIAVPDLDKASRAYRETLGAHVSALKLSPVTA